MFILLSGYSYAQNLSYGQVVDLFNTWKERKDISTLPILNKLHDNNPQWQYSSRGHSEDTRYYVWKLVDKRSDTTALALYIEEDATTVKYSLRYAFFDRATFLSMQTAVVGSGKYKDGRLTYLNDQTTHKFTTTGRGDDSLPMNQRTDLILTDFASYNDDRPRLFTLDISSRYIKK